MTSSNDWVLATEESGYTRHFGADALPIRIGGRPEDDITLAGTDGSLQIGMLDGVFFVQAARGTRNLRVQSELLKGSRRVGDGDVIALDSARLTCRLVGGRLSLSIEAHVTAGDTAPPDLEELARGGSSVDGEIEIKPISFRTADGDETPRGPRMSAGKVALGAAFAVLAVLGWFAFTAKSVELVFEPVPDSFSLPGTVMKVRMGDRLLLRSGSHRVTANLEGYYPLDTSFDVGRSPDQTIELSLTRLPGLISFETDPEVGADVRVDGESLGRTPIVDAEIRPGAHQLEFSAERFLTKVASLDVEGGHQRQSMTVTLTPNWAPVSLATDPPGAEIRVDGAVVGSTPMTMELEAGERRIEVVLRGFNAWSERLNVVAATPQELPLVKLTPADGRLDLASTPSEAVVSVDGEFRGRTPLTLALSPGRKHVITLTKPGFESASRELSVQADSGRHLDIELEKLFGAVTIDSEPPNAEIWVDGLRSGVTPTELTLSAVSHQIEIRDSGFAAQTAEITPRPGFPQQLSFELEALDESSGSGYAPTIRTFLGQELELIPAGQFTMGSSRGEQGRRSNEVLRDVKISRAFYLGAREVTNAEFRAFDPNHNSGSYAGVSLNEDDQPVVQVTWEEAVQYLNWLSIQDGLQPVYAQSGDSWTPVRPLRSGYRLPTEAEWAWAARAAGRDESLIYPWGQTLPPPDRSGNYADLSASQILKNHLVTYNDAFDVAAPAGSFGADALGLFDLGGNVAEWVQDYYAIDVAPPDGVLVDPLGPETGRFHMVRGSSWQSATVMDLRLAYRSYSADARDDLGFRLARNLE